MRHFAPLSPEQVDSLFLHGPAEVDPRTADARMLAMALGATLYSPGNRPRLAADLARLTAAGATSIVVCLEDAVRDTEVASAQENTVWSLRAFAARTPRRLRPLVFVRVRRPDQIPEISEGLGPHADVLTGFVAPKVAADDIGAWLAAIRRVHLDGVPVRLMPVLESAALAHPETRMAELLKLRTALAAQRDLVLAVRVGGTDLASAFALRRPRDLTVWELRPVADALTDIVGVFGRSDGTGFPVSGAVWEYFNPGPSPGSAPTLRAGGQQDTFAREISMDLAHGMTGKTVIHPSHVAVVNAAATVDHEEYADARDVVSAGDGGVAASAFGNKMNEARPHRAWADRLLLRAQVFGVRRPGVCPAELAAAVQQSADGGRPGRGRPSALSNGESLPGDSLPGSSQPDSSRVGQLAASQVTAGQLTAGQLAGQVAAGQLAGQVAAPELMADAVASYSTSPSSAGG